MHAGFPQISPSILQTINAGMQGEANLKGMLAKSGGHLVAEGLALALQLGFAVVMRDGLLDKAQSLRAQTFFTDNFEIHDSEAPGGIRYYQGRFLIRTRRAGDDMNVLLEFCPDPEHLYYAMPWGRSLDSFAVVKTRVMNENDADGLERHVDLVIRFKDAETILGLIGQPNVDIVGMLLQNLVQLTGNVGHLFKLGAIGADVQRSLAQ